MTVLRHHGFGELGPFAIGQHLAIPRAVIHGESDDAVASSKNSETTEKFYREDSACAAQCTLFRGNSNRLCAVDVGSRVRQPFSSCGSDDDLCAVQRSTNINPCVTVLSQTPHMT